MQFVNARHYSSDRPPSSLCNAVYKFIIYMIDEYFPLGIPTAVHLMKARILLLRIKHCIDNNNSVPLEFSNRFYEMIPHKGVKTRRPAFDMDVYNMKDPYVNSMANTLEALNIARKSDDENPIDHFRRDWLHAEISVLDRKTNDYEILSDVVRKTQHPNLHQHRVEKIFKVTTDHDFTNDISNHHYLFHFSFPSNLIGILREGLLVRPPYLSFDRRFGDGIYFTNAIANAGIRHGSMDSVYVLVCRVALGRMKTISYREDLKCFLGSDGDSAFCHSRIIIEDMCLKSPFGLESQQKKALNGATICCGQMKDTINPKQYHNNYDEYIVPSANQVKIEYIIKLKKP